MTARTVSFDFELRTRHNWIATPEEWAEFVQSVDRDLPTGTSDEELGQVYDALESGDWRAREAMHELAAIRNTWLDNGRAEPTDIQVEDVKAAPVVKP